MHKMMVQTINHMIARRGERPYSKTWTVAILHHYTVDILKTNLDSLAANIFINQLYCSNFCLENYANKLVEETWL